MLNIRISNEAGQVNYVKYNGVLLEGAQKAEATSGFQSAWSSN